MLMLYLRAYCLQKNKKKRVSVSLFLLLSLSLGLYNWLTLPLRATDYKEHKVLACKERATGTLHVKTDTYTCDVRP